MHNADFENFLKFRPHEETQKGVKQIMVSKLSSMGIPFLNGIPKDMLSSLALSVSIGKVPKDHVIYSNKGMLAIVLHHCPRQRHGGY